MSTIMHIEEVGFFERKTGNILCDESNHVKISRNVNLPSQRNCETEGHNFVWTNFINRTLPDYVIKETNVGSGKSKYIKKELILVDDASRTVNSRCHNPVNFSCSCGLNFEGSCNSRKELNCAICEMTWRKRVRSIARLPMIIARPGSLLLLTLTAPGKKQHCLVHTYKDKKTQKIRPSIRCTNAKGDCDFCECTSEKTCLDTQEKIADFNSAIVTNFNRFITVAKREVKGFDNLQYFRAMEAQERGALHIHAIIRLADVATEGDATLAQLIKIAIRYGFGHELDVQVIGNSIEEQAKTARYVAKYVSKSSSVNDVPLALKCGFSHHMHKKARRPRTWTASRKWGCSYSQLVRIQTAFVHDEGVAAQMTSEWEDVVYEHQALSIT